MKTLLTLILCLPLCGFAQTPPPAPASAQDVIDGTATYKFVSPYALSQSSLAGGGAAVSNRVIAAVPANFYTNSTPHYLIGYARLGISGVGTMQCSVTNSANTRFFDYTEDALSVSATSNTIAFTVPPYGWYKFAGQTTVLTEGNQALFYYATNGSVSFATTAGTVTDGVTQTGLAAGSYAVAGNGSGLTNLFSVKNEASLAGARFAAGKAMAADYTYPSLTNLLTVTIISESWSWVNAGWHKQLEERLKEQLGNGGEFSLIVAPYTGSMPTPSWTTTTNGTWLNKEYYFEAQTPGGIGTYIAFTNLYCRYADVWYQPTASSTMDVYTNGVLYQTTSGASSLATNVIIDFGELRTHTLCLTNAGSGMRVTALNALTGEPGVNVRSISFSGYQASDFWTNVAYQSFLNHRQITNDCVLIRHGLNEYLTGGAGAISGFETNLYRLATNIHTTFPVASVVLMSSPQVGTLATVYAEEINTKVRRMSQTNSAWIYYSDGLNNQWTAADGTALGAWNGVDTQHYNSRGYSSYANYICRDVFGFTPSAIRRRSIWLSPLTAKLYSGGTVDAPASPPITRPLYDINGNNTIVIFPQIQSGAAKQLVYDIPSSVYEGATTFALTQYYLTTNIQPVNTYKEIACINMDDSRRTVKLGAATSTYQQLLAGTNVFRVREVFSTTTKLSSSYYVAIQAGVSSLTNSIWAMGIKLEAW